MVQFVRDSPQGRALAEAFRESRREWGQSAPATVMIRESAWRQLGYTRSWPGIKRAVMVIWDDDGSLQALEELAAAGQSPELAVASSSYLGTAMLSLPKRIREFTWMTYPFGITQPPQERSAASMGIKRFSAEANAVASVRISQQGYIISLIMDMALTEMRGNYYRDNLLDLIGTIMD